MALVVSVSDPQRVIESLPPSTYVTYKVSTSEKPEVVVTRRFADFVWLYDQLGSSMPGMIVPAIPKVPKVNRFGDFVDTKRKALERFLNRIASHVELSRSSVFETFLFATSAEFKEATRKSPLSSRAKEWLEEKVSLVKDKVVQTKDMVTQASRSTFISRVLSSPAKEGSSENASREEKEDEFRRIADDIASWEPVIQGAWRKAVAFTSSTGEVSRTLLELGDGLRRLGECEMGDASVSLNNASTCLLTYANLVEAHKESQDSFEDSLLEYSNIIDSVQRALSIREEARVSYQQARSITATARNEYASSREAGGKEAPAQAKVEQIERFAAAEQSARMKLDRVSDDFITDYERFKQERSHDIQTSVVGFVRSEVSAVAGLVWSKYSNRLRWSTIGKLWNCWRALYLTSTLVTPSLKTREG